jgi:ATP/maltotriose-dependent transcriptional regulator MalT
MKKNLLVTKTLIPLNPINLVARPNLFLKLDQVLKSKFALISAPAGYGKTTLISTWANRCEHTVAWISLDENDNNLSIFLSYLISALETFGVDYHLLNSEILRGPRDGYRAQFNYLGNAVAIIPEQIIIVLDDYHLIKNMEIHKIVDEIIKKSPPNFHLIIGTRVDPPLSFARFRVRNQIVEIRSEDLRFRTSEISKFFTEANILEMTKEEILTLETKTEGWSAGLQLAALSLQKLQTPNEQKKFIEEFDINNYFIKDYLGAETIKLLDPKIREFLIKTSILERFSSDLCQAVTGNDEADQILKWIYQQNLFIFVLDQKFDWYRYHHLFAELLQMLLHEEYSEQIEALHLKAANWYRTQHLYSDAMKHAILANDIKLAADIFSLSWCKSSISDSFRMGYLNQYKESNMVLNLLEQFHIKESLKISNEGKEKSNLSDIEGYIFLTKANMAYIGNEYYDALKYSKLAVDRFDEHNLLRTITLTIIAKVDVFVGNYKEAQSIFEQLIPILRAEKYYRAYAECVTFLTMIYCIQGRLSDAIVLNKSSLQDFVFWNPENFPFIGLYYANLAKIYFMRNELIKVEGYLEKLTCLSSRSNHMFDFCCSKMQTRLSQRLSLIHI